MPLFHWEAWTTAGEARQGAQIGGSEVEIIATLRTQGLRVTAVRREQQHVATPRAAALRPEVRRCLRELAALRALGRSVPEALALMAEARRRRGTRALAAVPADELDLVRQAVEAGQPLGAALQRVPQRFDALVRRVLGAGEAAGDLDGALQRVAEHAERPTALDLALRGLIRLFLVGTALFALVLALAAVLAGGLYARLGVAPGLVGGILVAYGVAAALALGLLVAALLAVQTAGLRTVRDALVLRIPGLGAAVRAQAAERLARTLILLLTAPMPLLSALEIAAPRLGNAAIAGAVLRVQAMVARGVDLGTALADTRVFSPGVTTVTREAAGELAATMPAIAGLCAAEADELAGRVRRAGHVLAASFILLAAATVLALAWPLRT